MNIVSEIDEKVISIKFLCRDSPRSERFLAFWGTGDRPIESRYEIEYFVCRIEVLAKHL